MESLESILLIKSQCEAMRDKALACKDGEGFLYWSGHVAECLKEISFFITKIA